MSEPFVYTDAHRAAGLHPGQFESKDVGRHCPDGERFGGFEVFWVDERKIHSFTPGWYWDTFNRRGRRDGLFNGPYPTSTDAYNGARGLPHRKGSGCE